MYVQIQLIILGNYLYCINYLYEFFQTPYGQSNVPDWFDKLQTVIQSQEPDNEPSGVHEVTRKEWMILSDLNTPFDNSEQTPESTHDWYLDRANYLEQQVQEMPTWIKTNKEDYTIDEQYDVVDINRVKCKNLLMTLLNHILMIHHMKKSNYA